MKTTGAGSLLECLKKEGITYIFGNPGTTEVAILDALVEEPRIEYVLALHESVAVGMADGYARAGGRVGFVNIHTALGTANAIGNLYNAYIGRNPIVITIANKDSRILGRDCYSEVPDLLGMTRQFTKWSWQVLWPQKIAETIFRAIKVATSRPTGPVFVSIPEDFLAQEMEIELPPSQRFGSPLNMRPDPQQMTKALELLLEAQKPLMIAGNEIAKSGAMEEAVTLAEQLAVPVMTEGRQSLAFLNFPTTHALYRGVFDPESHYVQSSDLLLGIGCKIVVETVYSEATSRLSQIKTVHLHSDAGEIAKLYPVEVPILTEIKEGLIQFIALIKHSISNESSARLSHRFNALKKEAEEIALSKSKQIQGAWNSVPISLERLIKEINTVADEDAIIVDEAIRSSRALLNLYHFTQPATYFRSSGGYLGWGIPGALGVKLASPERQVIAFVGDGSFFFAPQALWTAARYNIPVVIVVCNNKGYKAVRDAAIRFQGRAAETNLFIGSVIDDPVPKIAEIAEGFGVFGKRITQPDELRPMLEQTLHSGKPAVLDVMIA